MKNSLKLLVLSILFVLITMTGFSIAQEKELSKDTTLSSADNQSETPDMIADLNITDIKFEIISDSDIAESGIFIQWRRYSEPGDRSPDGPMGYLTDPFRANLVFLNGKDAVLKLPVLIDMRSLGISVVTQVILDDDEWGIANIEEIDGLQADIILGRYHGAKISLCIMGGGSCFTAIGPKGLRLYSGNWSGGLDVDLSWTIIDLEATNEDPRWKSVIHFKPES
jgi:hypothetical protein